MKSLSICIILFLFTVNCFAQDLTSVIVDPFEHITNSLEVCKEDDLGVFFLCHSQWDKMRVDDAVLMIVSENPDVTFIVTKIETKIKFLGQLTKAELAKKDRYADGFHMVRQKVANHDAVKVKAFSKINPNKRLLDYYLISNNELYGILFSVSPKEKAKDVKFLIKKIVENFYFI